MAHLSILDGVRTVAVLLVVACHLLLQLGANRASYDVRAMGHLGVAIFFVHTTLVLLASLERHGAAPIPFYVRRIFRIYPLAIVIVLFLALLQLASAVPIDMGRLLSNLLLVQNLTGDQPYIGPLWSLPYEAQMYLLLPALYVVVRRMKRPVLWCAALFVGSVVLAVSDAGNIGHFHVPAVTAPIIRYVPCFAAGALAFALSGRIPKVLDPLWLAAVLAMGIALVPWFVGIGAPETLLMWTLCFLLAIVIPASREMSCQPIARAAKTVATYSYGAYLTHVFALGAIDGLMPGPAVLQWTAMLILLPGLAYVCYHGIEKPGVALGARLAAKLGGSERGNLRTAPDGDQASSL